MKSLALREKKRVEQIEMLKMEKARESSIKRLEIERKITTAKLTTEMFIKSQVDNFLLKEQKA